MSKANSIDGTRRVSAIAIGSILVQQKVII